MIKRFLVLGDVECVYFKSCNKSCYENCSVCAMNSVAVKKYEEEKKKKNYFKRLRWKTSFIWSRKGEICQEYMNIKIVQCM